MVAHAVNERLDELSGAHRAPYSRGTGEDARPRGPLAALVGLLDGARRASPERLPEIIAAAGRALSRRFLRAYERAAGRPVDAASLAWHQGVVCVRALLEVAGWVAAGTIEDRAGHPWVIAGGAFASRLGDLTGVAVTPR
jgi:hypothetical protein